MSLPPVAPPSVSVAAGAPLDPVLALTQGWRAFTANVWTSVGVVLVVGVLLLVGAFVPFVNLLFALLVEPALLAGGAWFFLRCVRGERPPFEDAFEGFRRWPSATGTVLVIMGVSLLITMPVIFALVGAAGVEALLTSGRGHASTPAASVAWALVLPLALVLYPLVLWWSARSYPALFIVMEPDRPGAVESVRRAFALTRGSVWRLVGLWLLSIPVACAGLLACGVGMIPAAIVMYNAFAHAYEQLRARAAGAAA